MTTPAKANVTATALRLVKRSFKMSVARISAKMIVV